jgi:hypothetical protein
VEVLHTKMTVLEVEVAWYMMVVSHMMVMLAGYTKRMKIEKDLLAGYTKTMIRLSVEHTKKMKTETNSLVGCTKLKQTMIDLLLDMIYLVMLIVRMSHMKMSDHTFEEVEHKMVLKLVKCMMKKFVKCMMKMFVLDTRMFLDN